MTANVRPLTLREILDRTLKIYRAKFLVFAGITALPALVYITLSTIERISALNPPNSGKTLLFHMTLSGISSKAVNYFIGEFIHLLAYPLLVFVTVSVISGQPSSYRLAFTTFKNRAKDFIVLALALPTFEVFVPVLLFSVAAVSASLIIDSRVGGAVTAVPKLFFALSATLLAICVVWVGASLSLSFAACVIERSPWLESIKRSWTLSRGARIRILLTWILVFVAAMGLIMVMVFPTAAIVFALHWKAFAWHGYPLYKFLTSLEIAAISTLIGPIFPIALTLFYYDQRIRHEGYDIERMMEAAGLNAPVTTPAEAVEGRA